MNPAEIQHLSGQLAVVREMAKAALSTLPPGPSHLALINARELRDRLLNSGIPDAFLSGMDEEIGLLEAFIPRVEKEFSALGALQRGEPPQPA